VQAVESTFLPVPIEAPHVVLLARIINPLVLSKVLRAHTTNHLALNRVILAVPHGRTINQVDLKVPQGHIMDHQDLNKDTIAMVLIRALVQWAVLVGGRHKDSFLVTPTVPSRLHSVNLQVTQIAHIRIQMTLITTVDQGA